MNARGGSVIFKLQHKNGMQNKTKVILNSVRVLAAVASLAAVAACTTPQNDAQATGNQSGKTISVSVDCAKQIGEIKPLNGINWGPQISSESAGIVARKQFYDLNVHSVRTHDVPLQNAGLAICDTDMIFPLKHADASDPKNYVFKPTDDYLKIASKHGAKIVFRLGISIDHSIGKYRTEMPDAKKFAEVCCRIIAHYNKGWANGHKMGIEYWEIWNEPECQNPDGSHTMWNGNLEQFTKFFIEVAKAIKAEHPEVKVGGPAFTYPHKDALKFINDIAKEKTPLDFFTWHCYSKSVEELVELSRKTRAWLDAAGYKNAENHINEWHYFPLSWKQLRADDSDKDALYAKINGLEAGVFAAATMTAWQDEPIDVSNYYYFGDSGGSNWGLLKDGTAIFDSYYPFKAFGEIVKYKTRLAVSVSASGGLPKYAASALAGKNANGETAVLVSLFKTGENTLVVDFKNAKIDAKNARVLICDTTKKLAPADRVEISGNKITVPVKSGSAAVLIKL